MSRIWIDIGPLRRFPHFRRLWTGYLFRQLGAQLTVTTVIYQVFALTHSNADVGFISLAQLFPAIAAALIGGAVADSMDRRRILVVTAVLFAIATSGLALNTLGGHPTLWVIYVCSAIIAGLQGVDSPTRTAAQVTLVDRGSVMAANVLRQTLQQTSTIVGPGLAGVLIAVFHGDVAPVYWIDVASTVAALQAVIRLPALLPGEGGRRFSLGSIAEGFGYLRDRQALKACLISDFIGTVFARPVALFPYLALVHYNGGARAFGLLSAAPAIGAGLGSVVSGWTHSVRLYGRWVLGFLTLWGLAGIGLGLSNSLWLGVVCAGVIGWSDAVQLLFRATILQLEVPDRLRARISSIDTAVGQASPRVGNTQAGVLASLTSAPIAIVGGGIALLVSAGLMATLLPQFAEYDISSAQALDEPA